MIDIYIYANISKLERKHFHAWRQNIVSGGKQHVNYVSVLHTLL